MGVANWHRIPCDPFCNLTDHRRLPPEKLQTIPAAAFAIVRTLRKAGHEALLAGGCVRDLLLGRPCHDFDIATSAPPEIVGKLFPKTLPVGVQFGVVVVVLHGEPYQVATFRRETGYEDGRHPGQVIFTHAAEDASRRDFTINGLFLDPESGEILDYVQGCRDLSERIIRAIGDPNSRFAEDHLRLLRAVRFAACLGFPMDAETWKALVRNAGLISTVSPERIREELVKILESPGRVRGLDLLESSGLLQKILPGIQALRGCTQPPDFHPEGDVYIHTRLMLALSADNASLPLLLAILFHDAGKPATRQVDESGRIRFNGHERVSTEMAEAALRRLRFSNPIIEQTCEIIRHHMSFKDVRQMRTAKLKRFLSRATFPDELEFHRLDCLGSHGLLDNHTFLLQKQAEFASEPLIPPSLVNGHDLIAMGIKPGPVIGELLEVVQTAQLEGQLSDRESALEYAKAKAEERGYPAQKK
jgi:poly(A) polymerase